MNEYTARAVVYGRTFMNTIIAALLARPGAALVVGAKVRLSKDAAFNPTPGSAIADFSAHEADYTGYAAGGVALTIGAPLNLGANVQGTQESTLFTATGSTITNVVYGYWIDDGANVILAERFAGGATAQFAVAGDFLALDTRTPFGLLQVTE